MHTTDLTHYINIIQKSGNLKYTYGLLILNPKNKQLKSYKKNINFRINVPISVGIKFCTHFSEFLLNFDINTYTEYTPMSIASSIYSSKYAKQISDLCPDKSLVLLPDSIYYNKIMFCNTVYYINNVILTNKNELSVYLLKQIMCLNKNSIQFFC